MSAPLINKYNWIACGLCSIIGWDAFNMTAIILIIARMRSAIQWFPCTAHACYVTFVFKIEMLPHSSSEVPAQFPILCVYLMSSNGSFANNRRRRQCARAFAYVMAECRRSVHAIDDQNNGGTLSARKPRDPLSSYLFWSVVCTHSYYNHHSKLLTQPPIKW